MSFVCVRMKIATGRSTTVFRLHARLRTAHRWWLVVIDELRRRAGTPRKLFVDRYILYMQSIYFDCERPILIKRKGRNGNVHYCVYIYMYILSDREAGSRDYIVISCVIIQRYLVKTPLRIEVRSNCRFRYTTIFRVIQLIRRTADKTRNNKIIYIKCWIIRFCNMILFG